MINDMIHQAPFYVKVKMSGDARLSSYNGNSVVVITYTLVLSFCGEGG